MKRLAFDQTVTRVGRWLIGLCGATQAVTLEEANDGGWGEDELTVVIEHNPCLPRRRCDSPTYYPPPIGRHDNDRPTLTDLPVVNGDEQ